MAACRDTKAFLGVATELSLERGVCHVGEERPVQAETSLSEGLEMNNLTVWGTAGSWESLEHRVLGMRGGGRWEGKEGEHGAVRCPVIQALYTYGGGTGLRCLRGPVGRTG